MKNESLVIDMYKDGNSIKDILITSGYSSPQSIMNILDRNNIQRHNIKSYTLPEQDIYLEWINNVSANSRNISKKYKCSPNTITTILKKNCSKEQFDFIKRNKISQSSKKHRQTIPVEERIKKAKYASSFVNPIERNKRLLEGAKISAQRRKGVPLSKEKYKYFVTDRKVLRGEFHPNWKGGVSKRQSRKPNWDKYQKLTRDRDNNTCQACSINKVVTGQNMDVHHIVSYHSFEDKKLANIISNLICLCRKCHMRVEHGIIECPKIIK
jgi:5-methylcytosine-specific restriction endonuclease McrA